MLLVSQDNISSASAAPFCFLTAIISPKELLSKYIIVHEPDSLLSLCLPTRELRVWNAREMHNINHESFTKCVSIGEHVNSW